MQLSILTFIIFCLDNGEHFSSPEIPIQEAQADIEIEEKSSQVHLEDTLQIAAREAEQLRQQQEAEYWQNEARLVSQREAVAPSEEGENKKPGILSSKWRRRNMLLGSSLVVLIFSAFLLNLKPNQHRSDPNQTPQSGSQSPKGTEAQKPSLQGNVQLTGAGATFPAPLYQNWFVQLNQEVPQLQVNYQSVGSGAGVEQFVKGTVDFGASDVAMKDEEIKQVSRGVLMLPMTAGSIVIAYNLPGVEGLKLSQEAQADIFLGKISKWNDPKIVKENPDLKLPDKPIIVVHRSDGSGMTGVFTKYLSAISPEFDKSIGSGKSVQWPTDKGKFLGGKGNENVTAVIQLNEGALGYIEYGYAKNNKNNNLAMASLQNKAGQYITPNEESAADTLASVELPADLRAFIVNPEGENSYPIVTYTWILAYKKYDDPNKAIAMEATIQYGLTKGQEQSAALGYVPLPENVREKVAAAADKISPDYKILLK